MGVLLTPIVAKETITLDTLRGRRLAVDGNGELYQFLALIRLRDGTPLRDSTGRTTSHLSGLFYRTTRLIAEAVQAGIARPLTPEFMARLDAARLANGVDHS